VHRLSGSDTLDEPVMTTIVSARLRDAQMTVFTSVQARDAFSIYNKLVQVLWPRRSGQGREVLRYIDHTARFEPVLIMSAVQGLGPMGTAHTLPNISAHA
jgi:hypothetical protein